MGVPLESAAAELTSRFRYFTLLYVVASRVRLRSAPAQVVRYRCPPPTRLAEVADVLIFGLLLAAIPFVLPIASWVAARRTRARVEELSRTIRDQQSTIETLSIQIAQIKRETRPVDAAGQTT